MESIAKLIATDTHLCAEAHRCAGTDWLIVLYFLTTKDL